MKKNPSPHDATFRQFLTQPDIARDFMEIHLPAELRAICDLSTLKLESGSFFEDDLRHYFQRRRWFSGRKPQNLGFAVLTKAYVPTRTYARADCVFPAPWRVNTPPKCSLLVAPDGKKTMASGTGYV